jgi:dynamin 1-like protein
MSSIISKNLEKYMHPGYLSSLEMENNNSESSKLIILSDMINGIFSDAGKDKINMPTIVVVGTQSSGKSTLLNRIIGFKLLPTGSNMVTRTPIEIKMKFIQDSAYALIEIGKYYNGEFVSSFKVKINSEPNEVELKTINEKLCEITDEITLNKNNISQIPIVVIISSPKVKTLSLVDLPGLVALPCPEKGQPLTIVQDIQALAEYYIKQPRTIIMAIIQAKSDLETDMGLALVKRVTDENNITNICGILTKPDLLESDNASMVNIKKILDGNISKSLMVNKGYFLVNNNTRDENAYFSSSFYSNHKQRCGIANIVPNLTKLLITSIKDSLPEIVREITETEAKMKIRLFELGEDVTDNPNGKLQLIVNCTNLFEKKLNESIESKGTMPNMGADIKAIFSDLAKELDKIEPFTKDKCSDSYLSNMMKSFEGYHMTSFVSPIELLEKCISDKVFNPIGLLKDPLLICIEKTGKLLLARSNIILDNSNTVYLTKYNIVIRNMKELITKFIDASINNLNNIVSLMIQSELDLIYTDNKDFQENLKKMPNTSNTVINNTPFVVNKLNDNIFDNELFKYNDNSSYENKIRSLFKSYYDTIKSDFKIRIPKYIMSTMVRKLQREINEFLVHELTNDDILETIKEDVSINDERKEIQKYLIRINKSKVLLNTI